MPIMLPFRRHSPSCLKATSVHRPRNAGNAHPTASGRLPLARLRVVMRCTEGHRCMVFGRRSDLPSALKKDAHLELGGALRSRSTRPGRSQHASPEEDHLGDPSELDSQPGPAAKASRGNRMQQISSRRRWPHRSASFRHRGGPLDAGPPIPESPQAQGWPKSCQLCGKD